MAGNFLDASNLADLAFSESDNSDYSDSSDWTSEDEVSELDSGPLSSVPSTSVASDVDDDAFVRNVDNRPKVFPFVNSESEDVKVRNFDRLSRFDVFKLFFNQPIMQIIVEETNRFGSDKYDDWEEVDVNGMYRFFAIAICMGLNKKPKLSDYWSTSDIYHQNIFSNTISRNRFIII